MQQPYQCVWAGRVGGCHVSVCVWRRGRLVCGGTAIRVLSGFCGCVPHAGQAG